MKLKDAKKSARAFKVMKWCILLGLIALLLLEYLSYSPCWSTQKARVTTTSAKLDILHNAVNAFKLDTGRYPTEKNGLIELIEKPKDVSNWASGGYLECDTLPKDNWGNEFIYQLNPASGKPFVIISYGADGKPGGKDADADLYSTDFN